jgi:hypothetical protein
MFSQDETPAFGRSPTLVLRILVSGIVKSDPQNSDINSRDRPFARLDIRDERLAAGSFTV